MMYEVNIEVSLKRLATRLESNLADVSVVNEVAQSLRYLSYAFDKMMDLDKEAIILHGKEREKGLTNIYLTKEKIGEGHRDRSIEVWSSGGEL